MKLREVLSGIGFFPTLLYTYLTSLIGLNEYYSRIDNNVVLGALPWDALVEKLVNAENVTGVVSVVQDWELKLFHINYEDWAKKGVTHLKLNTVEFVPPTMTNIHKGLDFIDKIIKEGKTTYIHCKAGRTRSAILTACYLIKRYNMDADNAIKYIQTKRKQIKLGTKDKDRIQDCYSKFRRKDLQTDIPLILNPLAKSTDSS
uniref:Phosphatidylglycerophosphatase and protein-tyrosine phosphatase 1 n=1 Tax=Cacopsylla melanoneura TaxID=428564 RepID=A0A8D8Z1W5_9HEMI